MLRTYKLYVHRWNTNFNRHPDQNPKDTNANNPGRNGNDTPPPPAAPAIQSGPPTAIQQTVTTSQRPINFTLIKKAYLFDPPKTKHTVIKGSDWETELQISKWLHRPMRRYSDDPPFYPWLPPAPIVPHVNFDLVSAFNKGQH